MGDVEIRISDSSPGWAGLSTRPDIGFGAPTTTGKIQIFSAHIPSYSWYLSKDCIVLPRVREDEKEDENIIDDVIIFIHFLA